MTQDKQGSGMNGPKPLQSQERRQILWYIAHRMEYLQSQQIALKKAIEAADPFDYDLLKEFMENRGRLRELENIMNHIQRW